MPIQYHRAIPQNFKPAGYAEYNSVSWVLSFPNRKINTNSIRINSSVSVANLTANVYLPEMTGAHSFFESFTTKFSGSNIENIGADYARLVAMKTSATENDQSMLNAKNVCELKSPFASISNDLLAGEKPPLQPGAVAGDVESLDLDFSIKPMICLNNAMGNISYKKSGDITITTSLARNGNAFYGSGMDATVSYLLKDMEIVYTTEDEDGEDEQALMVTYQALNQSIQSNHQNMSLRVASIIDGCSASFQLSSEQNELKTNQNKLYHLPNISSLQFMFNDSTSSYISYNLKDSAEILARYVDSWNSDSDMNAVNMASVKSGKSFGVGLDVPELDLRSERLNIELKSAVSSTAPVIMYFYFKSKITV